MTLSPDEVRHVAKLARIALTEEEVEQYAKELSGILNWIDVLQEVDTTGVKPTAQVTGLTNVMREDIITPFEKVDDLLEQSPHTINDQMITIPNIMNS